MPTDNITTRMTKQGRLQSSTPYSPETELKELPEHPGEGGFNAILNGSITTRMVEQEQPQSSMSCPPAT